MQNEEEVITQEVDTETTENTEEVEEQVDVEALKKENETLKAQKDHWRKKAEEKSLEVKNETNEGLSIGDTLYLAKTDIHEEDVQDVLNYAMKMGVSVKDAYAFYKPILKERQEVRQTAIATQTGGGNRGTKGTSPDTLLKKAESGELPDESDIDKLTEARLAQRLAQK
jgi:hypothetical protein